ncbi:hypothetical protein [Yoonia sp.]|uniref:hypothetical protein n=1 Tax=Yoonia sp. TaxID=2212373 RepID=UPI001A094638|nr:hypothetical protein [Yoonia sp.]MBE0413001.1 hypothetical protein [Yoonia sp.]
MSQTTPACVAERATLPGALPLNGLTLIGIFTLQDGPAALLRSSNGQIARATPGTAVLGVTVTAISAATVMLVDQTGTSHALAVPGQ